MFSTLLNVCLATVCAASDVQAVVPGVAAPADALARYRADLAAFRREYGGSRSLPDVAFFQFGMGLRRKLLFKNDTLLDAQTGAAIERWPGGRATIVPPEYCVAITLAGGRTATIREDRQAVWIEQGGSRRSVPGTESPVRLPDFKRHRYASILRVLHHEILMNVTAAGPTPNFFVYKKPWYRDGVMMAWCLRETGNLDLLRPWIAGLAEPFDRNNGQPEPDNLGQALYLVSMVANKSHPLVPKVLAELPRFEFRDATGRYIKGRTDFAEHPVYQTKWAKLGLRALGLDDPYTIPQVRDSYSSLFWMDYCDRHLPGSDADDREAYPYLGWATDHFQGAKRSPISDRDYPLTWEANASQADYAGMKIVDPEYVRRKTCAPHTWHAAEVFLQVLFETPAKSRADAFLGRQVEIAGDAYLYRANRSKVENPPESGILLMQYANLPFDEPPAAHRAKTASVLSGLLWEEVRPVRRIEMSWAQSAIDGKKQPRPEEIELFYFDATDDTAHTWWNPRSVKSCGKPEASWGGRTYRWNVPVDTWAVVAVLRDGKPAAGYLAPTDIRALTPEVWKVMDLEIQWGFDNATAAADYTGAVLAYGGNLSNLRPLPGDAATATRASAWSSLGPGNLKSLGRPYRGVQLSLAYQGTSRWRRVWPYHAQPEDVARTIVTVWTRSGQFSFLASDLELGPILAPEYGFFVRAVSRREAPAKGKVAKQPPPPLTPLGDKMDSIPGVPKVRGWASNVIPWFGVNATNEPGSGGSLTIPARAAAMHPEPTRDVAAVWRSPIAGRVNISGRVAMADSAGGNGVTWAVVHDHGTERKTLASGAVDTGGAATLPTAAQEKALAAVDVSAGDTLALVLGAKNGDHVCDTTIVECVLREIGGQGRTWDLTRDVIDNIHAGNPHADRLGNAGVWSFCGVAASQPLPVPAPSEPPFPLQSHAKTAAEFQAELAARGLKTIRQRTREHAEQTWLGAVSAMHPGYKGMFPKQPGASFEPAMQVDVPCERLTAQWRLGAWHILRRSAKQPDGAWRFNDYPFGILSSETYMILRALDLQGMHREAADGLDQWLRLPFAPRIVPGAGGHHAWAKPDRPLGHFSDGRGCFTHAEGIDGAGGHMDGVHAMGPGAIVFTMAEHYALTGDRQWLAAHAPRIRANAEWILRQRKLLQTNLPGGERLWSRGLQPAQVVTPDSMSMHMQFYETEAYYWLAVKRTAELISVLDPAEGAKMACEAEAYRRDLLAAIDRSIAQTPVVAVRDGTYRSFIPFAPYVRGFAAGAWGWRRCQGHVGAIYWDTVQSADPLVSPSGLLSPNDRRVQGHLDVLEDRLLLENTKVHTRTANYDAKRDWFAHASFQYQCGLERHANIHLSADDVPNFLRSMLNQYAVDIMPGEYTFREHTTGGPPDKIYEESCFLERFRWMLVMEDGGTLWLARATPRAWLAQGKHIAVRNAPSHFGPVSYRIESDAEHGTIRATLELPTRLASSPPAAPGQPRQPGQPGQPGASVLLRLRHPAAARLQTVEVNGKSWTDFDAARETISLGGLTGRVDVAARYRSP